jgi:hypothetical protein
MSNIDDNISSIKEVLSNLPKNNNKNKEKYLNTVNSYKEEYLAYKNNIYNELIDRYNKILNINKDSNISSLEEKIALSKSYFRFINPYCSSYELSLLDRVLFDLSHYYKGDLDRVLKDIDKAIKSFLVVGIKLSYKDFKFSRYAMEFMDCFFDNYSNNNIGIIKDKFSSIYWKCSNLIVHIEINFKYLYWKNKKIFDNYYKNYKKELFKDYGNDTCKYIDNYYEIKKEYDDKVFNDKYTIIYSFINKENDILQYDSIKNDKNLSDLILGYNTGMDINYGNVFDLYCSLLEYKRVLDYSLIFDKFKELYSKKGDYKNKLKSKFKDISKLEGKLFSFNKKINSKCIFSKKSDSFYENLDISIDNMIIEIKKLYDELDFDRFYDIVSTLEDNTSYYDILLLVKSSFVYLRSIYKENDENVEDNYIYDIINSIDDLLYCPYNTLIDNINIVNTKDLGIVISDKYRLMNFNINSDMLDSNNIDSSINICKKILFYKSMVDKGINVEDISFVIKFKDIISK